MSDDILVVVNKRRIIIEDFKWLGWYSDAIIYHAYYVSNGKEISEKDLDAIYNDYDIMQWVNERAYEQSY